MAAPIIRWFVETAGETTLPWETPDNWQELSSSEEEHDQILFASSESTEDVLLPMKRPAEGAPSTAPSAMFLRSVLVDEETSVETVKYIKIPNWGNALKERVTLCAQFSAVTTLGCVLIAKPRLEAYDNFDDAYTGADSETPLLNGTKSSLDNPLVRAVDTTLQAKNNIEGFPPTSWYFSPSIGSSDEDKRTKYLNGYDSFLECGEVIVPEGGSTIIDGTTYTFNDESESDPDYGNQNRSYFFFSVCPIIPDDILRGQVKKDVILIVRSFYA
jgi:hypothetical protein